MYTTDAPHTDRLQIENIDNESCYHQGLLRVGNGSTGFSNISGWCSSVYGLLLGLQALRSMAMRYDCSRISGL